MSVVSRTTEAKITKEDSTLANSYLVPLIILPLVIITYFFDSIVSIRIGPDSVSITNLGVEIGETKLFNLISHQSGYGNLLLLGSILLFIISIISAVIANTRFTFAALILRNATWILALALVEGDYSNRETVISSIVVHTTTSTNVSISPTANQLLFYYILIIMHSFAIFIIKGTRKANINA